MSVACNTGRNAQKNIHTYEYDRIYHFQKGFGVTPHLKALKSRNLPVPNNRERTQLGKYLYYNSIDSGELSKRCNVSRDKIRRWCWFTPPFSPVPVRYSPKFNKVVKCLIAEYGAHPLELVPESWVLLGGTLGQNSEPIARDVDRWKTPKHYAEMFGLSRSGVWQRIRAGSVEVKRIDGVLFIVLPEDVSQVKPVQANKRRTGRRPKVAKSGAKADGV